MTSQELADRLINFAARVGKVVDALPDTRMGRHIAGQFVRSGTSPAPNYEEACAAESRADFSHKLSICLKELRESRCWIRLIIKTEMLPEHRMGELLDECVEPAVGDVRQRQRSRAHVARDADRLSHVADPTGRPPAVEVQLDDAVGQLLLLRQLIRATAGRRDRVIGSLTN